MKKLFTAALLILLALCLQAEIVDKIIARVGSDIILLSDLSKQISQMKSATLFGHSYRVMSVDGLWL